MPDYHVIVVGAGNAALAAAVSAREQGTPRVLVLETAPADARGGNTHFSGGLFRFAFDTADDLEPLVPDADDEHLGFTAGIEPYPKDAFRADLDRVTGGRTDADLSEILIGRSHETVRWVNEVGVACSLPADDNEIAAIRVPTPIVAGADDPGTPVAAHRVTPERIAGSKLGVIA